ncbi:MAG: BrxA family protein [Chlorobium sp.]
MEKINSQINAIGSIPDFNLIEVALEQFARGKGKLDLKELLVTNNAFDFRTEASRTRFMTAVNGSILLFANDKHKELIESLFRAKGHESLKRKAVFWQLLAGNELFQQISKDVYAKAYFSGRAALAGPEIFAFLKELQNDTPQLKTFSDSTIDRIASKYLTILKKLDMAEGAYKKRLLNVRLTENEILFFTYFILSADDTTTDILKSPYREFFFMEKPELVQALKNIKFMPFIDITSTGEAMNVNLKLSPQELMDAISH